MGARQPIDGAEEWPPCVKHAGEPSLRPSATTARHSLSVYEHYQATKLLMSEGDDLLSLLSKARYAERHDVSGLQETGWRHAQSDAGRSARRDDVPGF